MVLVGMLAVAADEDATAAAAAADDDGPESRTSPSEYPWIGE